METIYEKLINFKDDIVLTGKNILLNITPDNINIIVGIMLALGIWTGTFLYLLRRKGKK